MITSDPGARQSTDLCRTGKKFVVGQLWRNLHKQTFRSNSNCFQSVGARQTIKSPQANVDLFLIYHGDRRHHAPLLRPGGLAEVAPIARRVQRTIQPLTQTACASPRTRSCFSCVTFARRSCKQKPQFGAGSAGLGVTLFPKPQAACSISMPSAKSFQSPTQWDVKRSRASSFAQQISAVPAPKMLCTGTW